MPRPPLRVGIIGLGGMGRRHLAAFRKQAQASVVAALVRREDHAAQASAELGLPVGTSRDEFFAASPQLVVISTPTASHAELLRECVERGCAVLVEKPLAASFAEAEALVEWTSQRGAWVQVAHPLPYDPVVEAVREAQASRNLGELVALRVERSGPLFAGPRPAPGSYPEPQWLYEQLVHLCALCHCLAGEYLPAQLSITERQALRHAERLRASWTFPAGASGELHLTPEGDAPLLQAELRYERQRVLVRFGGAGQVRLAPVGDEGAETVLPVGRGSYLERMAADVLQRLSQGQPPRESAVAGLEAMRAAWGLTNAEVQR